MGSKERKIWTVVLVVLLCLIPSTTYAATAEELYAKYNITYESPYPYDVIETISAYDNAKKFVAMYSYVITSEYDVEALKLKVEELTQKLNSTEVQLLDGYNLSTDEIYALEDNYITTKEQLENARLSLASVDLNYSIPNADNTPTYSEYKSALSKKNAIDAKCNVGDIEELSVPVSGNALVYSSVDKYTTYSVSNDVDVLALFNGVVSDTSDKYVIINHYNNIYTRYDNLYNVSVEVGDTVVQGQVIGRADKKFNLALKLAGRFVDVNELF